MLEGAIPDLARKWQNAKFVKLMQGCVVEGRRVKAGEEWDEGEYTYTCAKKSDRAIIECVGCMNEGRRLRSGDRYMRDESVVQCAVSFEATFGRYEKV